MSKKMLLVFCLALSVLVSAGFAGSAFAIGSAGAACFEDSAGDLYWVDYFDYGTSNVIYTFGLSGWIYKPGSLCNNTHFFPFTGIAVFLPSGTTLMSINSMNVDYGVCNGNVTMTVPFDQSTGGGPLSLINALGNQFSRNIWNVTCSSVIDVVSYYEGY